MISMPLRRTPALLYRYGRLLAYLSFYYNQANRWSTNQISVHFLVILVELEFITERQNDHPLVDRIIYARYQLRKTEVIPSI